MYTKFTIWLSRYLNPLETSKGAISFGNGLADMMAAPRLTHQVAMGWERIIWDVVGDSCWLQVSTGLGQACASAILR